MGFFFLRKLENQHLTVPYDQPEGLSTPLARNTMRAKTLRNLAPLGGGIRLLDFTSRGSPPVTPKAVVGASSWNISADLIVENRRGLDVLDTVSRDRSWPGSKPRIAILFSATAST